MDTSMSFLDTGREPGDAPAAFLGFRHRVRPARRRGVEDVLLEVLSCAKADAEDEVDELAEPSYVETRPSPVNRSRFYAPLQPPRLLRGDESRQPGLFRYPGSPTRCRGPIAALLVFR